jgi:hypothetical protein
MAFSKAEVRRALQSKLGFEMEPGRVTLIPATVSHGSYTVTP